MDLSIWSEMQLEAWNLRLYGNEDKKVHFLKFLKSSTTEGKQVDFCNHFESYKRDESYPDITHVNFSMKYIYRFLKEHKFAYGEVSGSKTFFPKTKLEEIRSELERHYEKYEDEYIVNFDESMFLINEMRRKMF